MAIISRTRGTLTGEWEAMHESYHRVATLVVTGTRLRDRCRTRLRVGMQLQVFGA